MDSELKQFLEGIESRLSTRIDAVSAGMDTVSTRIDAVSAGIDEVSTRIDAVSAGIDEVSTRIDAVSAGIDEVSTRIDAVSAGIDSLDARLRTLETRVDVLDVTLNERIEKVETNLLTEFHKWASPTELRIKSHSATLRALDAEMDALAERLKKLENGKADRGAAGS